MPTPKLPRRLQIPNLFGAQPSRLVQTVRLAASGLRERTAQRRATQQPMAVSMPFRMKEPVGLGDVIQRATAAVGIKPCGACQQRAQLLNSMVVIKGKPPKR